MKNLFSAESGKTFLIVVAATMLSLAVHQKFVAPIISKK